MVNGSPAVFARRGFFVLSPAAKGAPGAINAGAVINDGR